MIQLQPQYALREQWEALARQEGLSYEVLELSAPPERSPSAARDWYAQCGRVNALHGAFIDVNPASGDPAFRQLSRRRCHESCALARALGARWVVFHGSAFPFLRGDYLHRWARDCGEFYRELARDYGLRVCVENSMDLDPEPLEALLEQTPQLQVCLDIGHAHLSRAPLEQWFDRLGHAIGYLHLSDNRGAFDDHLPLGTGSVDWALADRLWRQLGTAMPITLEVGGPEGARQSLAYLKRNGYFGMGG